MFRRIDSSDIRVDGGVEGEYPLDKMFTWNAFTSTTLYDDPKFGDVLFVIDFDKRALQGSLYVRPYSAFPGTPFFPLAPPHSFDLCTTTVQCNAKCIVCLQCSAM